MEERCDRQEMQAWLLLTFGDDRKYEGNRGYDDDPEKFYHYDSYVQNYLRIREDDVALIRAKHKLLGIAKIQRIASYNGVKERLRCPICANVYIEKRKKIEPRFRCKKGHTFSEPSIEIKECRHFKAHFGNSFIPAESVISITKLRESCPRYSPQMAMQRIDLRSIADELVAAVPETIVLLKDFNSVNLRSAEEAGQALSWEEDVLVNSYAPGAVDHRENVMRSIKARQGQQTFRRNLIARYGPRCMVSGCDLLDLVEAAHISPYRGLEDQHEENGLLLRADIHVLFDLELLGIEPDTLVVKLHPSARLAGYQKLEGLKLNCNLSPSKEALRFRWSLFSRRLKEESGPHY